MEGRGKVEWHREGEWRKTVKMGNGKGKRQLEGNEMITDNVSTQSKWWREKKGC